MASELKESKEEVCKNKEIEICLVEEFYREYNRLPKQKEKYKGKAIGQFLNNVRSGNTQVTEEQMSRLLKLGFEGQTNNIQMEKKIFYIMKFYRINGRLPEIGESLGRERPKVGDVLLEIKSGKIRITEYQLAKLQKLDTTLTREQVSLVKPKVYVKK